MRPGRIVGGRIRYLGEDLVGATEARLQRLRGKEIAMIFQDPMMTLNPVLRVDTQMVEAIHAHEKVSAAAAPRPRARRAGDGRHPVARRSGCWPIRTSSPGGMRQRVAIAIALLNRPQADHRRRAHHRAGRHHPGADPLRSAETLPRNRHRPGLDHARPRRGVGPGRPHCRDVRRAHRRKRRHRRRHPPAVASLYAGPDRLDSDPRHPRYPAAADPGHDAFPAAICRRAARFARAAPMRATRACACRRPTELPPAKSVRCWHALA